MGEDKEKAKQLNDKINTHSNYENLSLHESNTYKLLPIRISIRCHIYFPSMPHLERAHTQRLHRLHCYPMLGHFLDTIPLLSCDPIILVLNMLEI